MDNIKSIAITGKGGTGVPTRTMFAVLEDIAAKG